MTPTGWPQDIIDEVGAVLDRVTDQIDDVDIDEGPDDGNPDRSYSERGYVR